MFESTREKINHCKQKIAEIDAEIKFFEDLKNDWITEKRNMYKDYPNWCSYSYRTPMEYVNTEIDILRTERRKFVKALQRIYREDEIYWFEVECNPETMDMIGIDIYNNGSIKGTKL